jgi:hypothetical protein
MRWILVGLALVGPLAASSAWADPSGSDKAAAEGLFSEGRRLMDAGQFAQACPKFEASQRLDPGVGTMLNLAECYEKTGRTASAWAEFREVVSAARAADSKEREELARQRAQALEGKLSRLTIAVSPEAKATLGLEVRRDGALVDPAELGSAIPVDPGKHVIEAVAPGKQKWFNSLELAADGETVTVTIPVLVDGPSSGAVPVAQASADSNVPPQHSSSQRTAGLIVGGFGVAGLAMGTIFGVKASSNWSDAKGACTDYPYGCAPGTEDKVADAKSAGTLSTVGFIVGGVGLAAGALLWFTAGHAEDSTRVGVGLGRVNVEGRF